MYLMMCQSNQKDIRVRHRLLDPDLTKKKIKKPSKNKTQKRWSGSYRRLKLSGISMTVGVSLTERYLSSELAIRKSLRMHHNRMLASL